MDQKSLTRYAWLSIAAAIATIGLKTLAYLFTGSVGLLSDALESLVNLFGASITMAMLLVSGRPPDHEHPYGHNKAEYFASGVEGTLIVIAALSIAATAIPRLITPQPIEQIGWGMALSIVASVINFGVARTLLKAGKSYHSIALEADGKHLMTDVWTSAGVIFAVGLVAITGWQRLDPLIALFVAANILFEGWRLLRRTVYGLMDTALSTAEQDRIKSVLAVYKQDGIQFHALRTRRSGARCFVSVHVLVPGNWTVQRGHELLEQIENEIRQVTANVTVFTHLEPLDEAVSWEDITLDRSTDLESELF
jgi:cation diffusion facilitator family transporter